MKTENTYLQIEQWLDNPKCGYEVHQSPVGGFTLEMRKENNGKIYSMQTQIKTHLLLRSARHWRYVIAHEILRLRHELSRQTRHLSPSSRALNKHVLLIDGPAKWTAYHIKGGDKLALSDPNTPFGHVVYQLHPLVVDKAVYWVGCMGQLMFYGQEIRQKLIELGIRPTPNLWAY